MMSFYSPVTFQVTWHLRSPESPVLVRGREGYTYDFTISEAIAGAQKATVMQNRTIQRMSLQRLVGQGSNSLRKHTHTRSFHAPVQHR